MPEKNVKRERERDIEREESNRCLVGSWCCSWISYKSERIQAMRIIYDRPDRTPSRNPLWTVSLLFLLRCTINTIAVKNRDSRKIQTVSRAHDSLYRYGYNILSISEENSYSPPSVLRVYISYPSKIYSAWNFLLNSSLSLSFSLWEYDKLEETLLCLFEFLIRARIESLGKQRILVLFGSNLNQFKFEHRANEIYQFHKKRLVYVIYVGKKRSPAERNWPKSGY